MPIFRRWTARLAVPASGGGSWGPANLATISGGVLALEPGKWFKITTEGAVASDDIDTISGLVEGDEVMLSIATDGQSVVFKHGTGNLDLPGAVDIPLNATRQRARLMHDGTNLVEASSRP